METAETETITLREVWVQQSVEELYESAFPIVARQLHKLGASYADARDIFHDALVIFQEKIAEEEFVLKATPEAYLLGIAKHLWLRTHRHQRHLVQLSELEQELTIPADFYPDVNTLRLLHLLELTGRRCLDLLRAFYYQNLAPAAIASVFGYRGTHSATVQKYKCLEKVRQTVKEKAIAYEDFFN